MRPFKKQLSDPGVLRNSPASADVSLTESKRASGDPFEYELPSCERKESVDNIYEVIPGTT